MNKAYCLQSSLILYFLRAAGKTLWHGSSSVTRKDRYGLSACLLLVLLLAPPVEPSFLLDVDPDATEAEVDPSVTAAEVEGRGFKV